MGTGDEEAADTITPGDCTAHVGELECHSACHPIRRCRLHPVERVAEEYAPAYEKKGAKLTLTPLVLKALVGTLKKHPIFNSSLDEVAQEVVFKDYSTSA